MSNIIIGIIIMLFGTGIGTFLIQKGRTELAFKNTQKIIKHLSSVDEQSRTEILSSLDINKDEIILLVNNQTRNSAEEIITEVQSKFGIIQSDLTKKDLEIKEIKEDIKPTNLNRNLNIINTENVLKSISEFNDIHALYNDLNNLESYCQSEITKEQQEKLDSFIINDFEDLLFKIGWSEELEKTTEVFSVIYSKTESTIFHDFILKTLKGQTKFDEELELAFVEQTFDNYYPRRDYPNAKDELLEALKLSFNFKATAESSQIPVSLFQSFKANLRSINLRAYTKLNKDKDFNEKLVEIGIIKN